MTVTKRYIEFFDAASLDHTTNEKSGADITTMKVRFADGLDTDALREGSALFAQHMRSFATHFDDCELHIGIVEFAPRLISPLHSHSDDCVYYVERGSIIMGNRTLGPGEGFLVRKNQPYGFVVGPEGLRLLEFTKTARSDITFHERNPSSWKARLEKALGV